MVIVGQKIEEIQVAVQVFYVKSLKEKNGIELNVNENEHILKYINVTCVWSYKLLRYMFCQKVKHIIVYKQPGWSSKANLIFAQITTLTFPAYSKDAGTAMVMSNLSLPVDLDSDSNASRISYGNKI